MVKGRRRIQYIAAFADQAVLGVASIGMLILGAQFLDPDQFGALATGLLSGQIVVVIARSFSGEVLIADPNSLEADRVNAVRVALLAALASLALGVLLQFTSSLALQASGWGCMGAVGLVVQDAWRYAQLHAAQNLRALLVDGVLVCSQMVLIAVSGLIWGDYRYSLLAWGVPGIGFLCALMIRSLSVAALPLGAQWFWRQRAAASAFGFEAILGSLVQWATMWAVIEFSSIAEAGAFRAVISIFGLTAIALTFLRSFVLAQIGRGQASRGGREIATQGSLMALFAISVVSVWWVALELLPSSLGVELFGHTWLIGAPLLAFGALSRYAASLATIPGVLLRSLGVTWKAARTRSVVAIATLVSGPLGAWWAGAEGALLGLSLASFMMFLALASLVVYQTRVRPAEGL